MTNFSTLKNQAEYLLTKIECGKSYRIGDLNLRLRKAADEYPSDIVIKSMASVIENLDKKDSSKIVTQGDLEKLYQQFVGLNSNSKFREVLGDLLKSEINNVDLTKKAYIESIRDPEKEMINYDKSEAQSSFEKMFEITSTYDPNNVSKARNKVELELKSIGVNPRVRLAGGNSRFLIFSTNLESNCGPVPIYIPAEANGEKLPSIFIGSNSFNHLTGSEISNYIKTSAYNRDRLPEVSDILNTLDKALGNAKKYANEEEFEKNYSNIPKENGTEGLSAPGLFANLPDHNKDLKDIEIPHTPIPYELKPIANQIDESILEATVGFPSSSVKLAKNIVISELNSMGFHNSQLRIITPTKDGFICEAILNSQNGKLKIEIPIEMNNNVPLLPSVFAQDDYIADFTEANIKSLAMKQSGYLEGAIKDNNLNSMCLADLKDCMIKSATKNDFSTCDEIMEIISNKFDNETYKTIVAEYSNILKGLGNIKTALNQSYEDKDQFVKTPNSIYPVHKKLGLPAHELIKDENGEWHRKSAFTQKPSESLKTFFSTAKILVGD